jgi:hypothetical protein
VGGAGILEPTCLRARRRVHVSAREFAGGENLKSVAGSRASPLFFLASACRFRAQLPRIPSSHRFRAKTLTSSHTQLSIVKFKISNVALGRHLSRTRARSIVAGRILAELEAGAAPWVKPWSATPGQNMPHNAATGRPYGFWFAVGDARCAIKHSPVGKEPHATLMEIEYLRWRRQRFRSAVVDQLRQDVLGVVALRRDDDEQRQSV